MSNTRVLIGNIIFNLLLLHIFISAVCSYEVELQEFLHTIIADENNGDKVSTYIVNFLSDAITLIILFEKLMRQYTLLFLDRIYYFCIDVLSCIKNIILVSVAFLQPYFEIVVAFLQPYFEIVVAFLQPYFEIVVAFLLNIVKLFFCFVFGALERVDNFIKDFDNEQLGIIIILSISMAIIISLYKHLDD
uniref:Uncharacterized protein n=1 Tax=Cyanoptyche gloeocystis TaxID=77922 RepID=A0A096Y6V0_9EUKA|nr:hypothetical protein NX25_p34 [Cyanoptyche gloeocystis]AIM52061.1 hypothetical protein [Cyanoptyche gloeocystis]